VTAARAVYDASADRYIRFVGTELSTATEGPIDRAMLVAFVEIVANGPGPRVADIGCGPGRVAAFLVSQGLDAIGIDTSPTMLVEARRAHPDIVFAEGCLDDLPFTTGELFGAVCWYSIIHTPAERLVDAFEELNRVLKPGGQLLLAFQAGGGEGVHRMDAHGTGLPLTSYRHEVNHVTRGLEEAGFDVHATAKRGPVFAHETTTQAFVIARRR
jgi:SAM-dependent methyltransferase